MKRFFTFLMAVWALLSISQTVKADAFWIMGTFGEGSSDTWTMLDGKSMHSDGNNQYSQTYQCTKAGEYRFRFIGDGWNGEMCPELSSYNLTNASCNVFYTDQPGRKDNYFFVNMESGKTYTFTFYNFSKDNRTVACTVSGEGSGTVTPIEKYCSFYLIGNLHSDEEWKNGTKANLFTTSNGKTYTYTFTGVGKTVYFRVQGYDSDGKQFEKDLAPDDTRDKPLSTTFETVVYKPYNSSTAWHFDAKSDKTYTITLDYSDTSKPKIMYSEQGSGTETHPSDKNPIANRKYSEGYYLVGNFFNFDGDNINYDDAVFKFQQQKDDEKGNAVYMVEIPATLTAKAQVMSVGVTGTADAIYGPGSVFAINNSSLPVGADNPTATTGIKDLKSNIKIEDGTNYWDMTTRRTKYDGVGQDGSYKYYITVDKTTGKPSKWEIKYTDLKRVAYFISTDKSASALTIGSIRVNSTSNFGSGKYFGSLYIDKGGEYYAISNDLRANEVIDKGYSYGYGAMKNQIDRPTYNKLFLFGNNGVDATTGTVDAKLAANKGTFTMPSITGVYVLEFNSNKGNNSVEGNYGGTGAEIINRSGRNVISSLSMVGPAIPGTTTADGEWNWGSDAADMDFEVSENCYKLTIATTEENKNKEFRFVGDHTQKINWFENSNVDQSGKAAIYNNDGTYGTGHKASPSDPNEISYTESGLTENSGEDYHIIWNRPAGTWTVRFYIYTYSQDGNNPSFRYFYTISENRDLELRDFEDVVYQSETRNILKRGKYQYFRTWSDNKAWKRPKNVDVFVVSKTPAETSNGGFELTNINRFNPSEEVIPANTGVILALKENAEVPGAVFHTRKSSITYNTLVIPLEEATNKELSYDGEGKTNRLLPLIEAQVVPTKEGDKYNYLFGFYRANKVSYDQTYAPNDFLLGFWISNGTGAFYSNSAYLPIDAATANKMNLGVSYNDFDSPTGAKKVPGVIFDFANVGGTTGINEVVNQSTKLNDGKYYTLSGQQVEKPTAGGIYIHNGRKFVVK